MKTALVLAFACSLGIAAPTSPKESCEALAKAAQENNFAAFTGLTVGSKAKEKKFHKMHQDKMAALKNLTCGTETIAGNHAFVEATSQDEKRLVPFVQVNGTWKFDMGTYRTFYKSKTN